MINQLFYSISSITNSNHFVLGHKQRCKLLADAVFSACGYLCVFMLYNCYCFFAEVSSITSISPVTLRLFSSISLHYSSTTRTKLSVPGYVFFTLPVIHCPLGWFLSINNTKSPTSKFFCGRFHCFLSLSDCMYIFCHISQNILAIFCTYLYLSLGRAS